MAMDEKVKALSKLTRKRDLLIKNCEELGVQVASLNRQITIVTEQIAAEARPATPSTQSERPRSMSVA